MWVLTELGSIRDSELYQLLQLDNMVIEPYHTGAGPGHFSHAALWCQLCPVKDAASIQLLAVF